MATANVSYVPGALTAVAGDQCWALAEISPDSPAVTRIWQPLPIQPGTVVTLADGIDFRYDPTD